MERGAPLIAPLTDAFFERPMALHQAVRGFELGGAGDGPKDLAVPPPGKDTVGLGGIGFPGALWPGLAVVPYRWAMDQADLIVTAFEPFVEGLPVDT